MVQQQNSFFQGLSDEVLARNGVIFLAESAIGLVLALVLLYFSQVYKRHYLKTWAYSWFAFSFVTFNLGFATLYGLSRTDFLRLSMSIGAQIGTFLHLFFLLGGAYELINVTKVKTKTILLFCACITIVGIVTTLLYNNVSGSEAIQFRFVLRTLSRMFFVACCFLTAGVIVWKTPAFTRNLGQRIMVLTFLSYGLMYVYYFTIGILTLLDYHVSFPFFFGMIEMVLISLMGTSIVMWLLEDERERLNKVNKELDRFLYSTSHDLRAPIASILGLTNLAKLEIKDTTALDYMKMIEGRMSKLDSVISDILSLSRNKKIEVNIEVVDFSALVNDVLTDLKYDPNADSILIDYQKDPMHVFLTDYNQLKAIISNLLSNAIKYHNLNQTNPFIKINFIRRIRHIEISIADNGQGMTKEVLPHIFEMFYRGSYSSDGTGLGLYIVKESVSKINGTIEVTSELKKGTTFTMTFPKV